MPLEPLVGRVFGKLTVVAEAEPYFTPRGQRKRQVVCACSCGKTITTTATSLRSKNTASCGCLRGETSIRIFLRHGGAINGRHTRTYKTWLKMRERCLNPGDPCYHNYGGRGITVCDRWLGKEGFQNFLADMGEKPAGLSIEREDNEKGYFPENCRWATKLEQSNNTRSNVFIEYNGKRQTAAQWEREMGLPPEVIAVRIRKGQSPEQAITTPLRIWPNRRKILQT